MLQRYLVVWLILSSLVAFFWPWGWEYLSATPLDPFLLTKPWLPALIQITMLAIGTMLPREEVLQVVRHWPTVLGGTAVQYLVMPLLAFGVGRLLQLDDDLFIGLVMVGCVPGAMASNVLTLQARGNVSYSVSLTTSATLLSPLMVPLAIYLTLSAKIEQDFLKVSLDLVKMVVGPVLAGFTLSQLFPPLQRIAVKIGPVIANLAILWVIAVVVALKRDVLTEISAVMLVALLLVNLLGYAGGYGGGTLLRLAPGMRRALTLEVGMQNAGLGTVLTLQYFPEATTAVIAPAVYTFGCMLTGTMLAQYWRRQPVDEDTSDIERDPP